MPTVRSASFGLDSNELLLTAGRPLSHGRRPAGAAAAGACLAALSAAAGSHVELRPEWGPAPADHGPPPRESLRGSPFSSLLPDRPKLVLRARVIEAQLGALKALAGLAPQLAPALRKAVRQVLAEQQRNADLMHRRESGEREAPAGAAMRGDGSAPRWAPPGVLPVVHAVGGWWRTYAREHGAGHALASFAGCLCLLWATRALLRGVWPALRNGLLATAAAMAPFSPLRPRLRALLPAGLLAALEPLLLPALTLSLAIPLAPLLALPLEPAVRRAGRAARKAWRRLRGAESLEERAELEGAWPADDGGADLASEADSCEAEAFEEGLGSGPEEEAAAAAAGAVTDLDRPDHEALEGARSGGGEPPAAPVELLAVPSVPPGASRQRIVRLAKEAEAARPPPALAEAEAQAAAPLPRGVAAPALAPAPASAIEHVGAGQAAAGMAGPAGREAFVASKGRSQRGHGRRGLDEAASTSGAAAGPPAGPAAPGPAKRPRGPSPPSAPAPAGRAASPGTSQRVVDLGPFRGTLPIGEGCMASEPDARLFQVRAASYLADRRKQPAGPAAFKLVAIDWTRHAARLEDVAALPEGLAQKHLLPAARLFRPPPPLVVINLQIPPFRGAHYSLAFYFLPREPIDPRSLMGRFLYGPSDGFRNARLKLIPAIREGPWVVSAAVGNTPAILGKALRITRHGGPPPPLPVPGSASAAGAGARAGASGGPGALGSGGGIGAAYGPGVGPGYLELDADIGSSSAAAYIVGLALGYAKNIVVDLAFVVQGNAPEELPERVLGAVRLSHLDPAAARPAVGAGAMQHGHREHAAHAVGGAPPVHGPMGGGNSGGGGGGAGAVMQAAAAQAAAAGQVAHAPVPAPSPAPPSAPSALPEPAAAAPEPQTPVRPSRSRSHSPSRLLRPRSLTPITEEKEGAHASDGEGLGSARSVRSLRGSRPRARATFDLAALDLAAAGGGTPPPEGAGARRSRGSDMGSPRLHAVEAEATPPPLPSPLSSPPPPPATVTLVGSGRSDDLPSLAIVATALGAPPALATPASAAAAAGPSPSPKALPPPAAAVTAVSLELARAPPPASPMASSTSPPISPPSSPGPAPEAKKKKKRLAGWLRKWFTTGPGTGSSSGAASAAPLASAAQPPQPPSGSRSPGGAARQVGAWM